MREHKHGYYLPAGDFEFYEWALNFHAVAAAHAADWGLPAEELAAFQAGITAYKALLDGAYGENAGKEDIRRKNTAHRELAHQAQDLVNAHIRYNRRISPDDMAALGGPVRDGTRTPVPPPASRPAFTLRPVNSRELRIDFHDEGSTRRAIPYGLDGAILHLQVLEPGEAVPLDPEALPKTRLLTASPQVYEFSPPDQGKRVVCALCWQNEKGEKGPYTDIVTAVVP
ncbi:MAG: hypothetical protein LBG84_07935 [Treponema sp.]|nr:hypothetical protein [Treponema sp.]